VDESLYVAVAVSGRKKLAVTDAAGVVTATDVTPTIVKLALPDLPLYVALIVELPFAMPITSPAVTLASVALEEDHVAWLVTSF
jgi:hypothetical protein